MVSGVRWTMRVLGIVGCCVALALMGMCAYIYVTARADTSPTDGAGMAIFSALVIFVGASLGLFLCLIVTAVAWLPGGPSAGWYDDPVDMAAWRYWNGKAWTADVMPKPVAPQVFLPNGE